MSAELKGYTTKRITRNERELDFEALEEVLKNEDCKNCDVVVISILGPRDTGKSTLMNLLLLYAVLVKVEEKSFNSLKNEKLPQVFKTGSAFEAVTNGIEILSKPIKLRLWTRTIALFLMDTQGIFDVGFERSTQFIFGTASLLLSSRQLITVSKNIDSNHIDYIHALLKDLVNLAKDDESFKGIEKNPLTFIIKNACDELGYGINGGENYSNQFMKNQRHGLHNTIDTKKAYIMTKFPRSVFTLFPSPRQTRPNKISDFGERFLECMKELFEKIFERLPLKRINGINLTCQELFEFIQENGNETLSKLSAAKIEEKMKGLLKKHTNEFLRKSIQQAQKHQENEESAQNSIIQEMQKKFDRVIAANTWVPNPNDWKETLEVSLEFCKTIVPVVVKADEELISSINDFHVWFYKKAREVSPNQLENTAINTELTRTLEDFMEKVDERVADNCKDILNDYLEELLYLTREQAEKKLKELKSKRRLQGFFGFGRIVGGGISLGLTKAFAIFFPEIGQKLVERSQKYYNVGCSKREGDILYEKEKDVAGSSMDAYLEFTMCCGKIRWQTN